VAAAAAAVPAAADVPAVPAAAALSVVSVMDLASWAAASASPRICLFAMCLCMLCLPFPSRRAPELRGVCFESVGPHESTYGSLRGGPTALLW
jgi:hypothetical protein